MGIDRGEHVFELQRRARLVGVGGLGARCLGVRGHQEAQQGRQDARHGCSTTGTGPPREPRIATVGGKPFA